MKNNLPAFIAIMVFSLLYASCGDIKEHAGHPAIVSRLIDSGWRMYDSGNQAAAYHFLDRSFDTLTGPCDRFNKYAFKKSSLLKSGLYHEQKKEYISMALRYADSMLLAADDDKACGQYYKEFAEANFSKGDVLFAMGNYPEAYRYYYEGRVAAEKGLDPCERGAFMNRFADIAYRQGKYQEAARYFSNAFILTDSCDLDFERFAARQALLDNVGLSYDKSGMPDSALRYYERALAYILRYENLFPVKKMFSSGAKAVVYGNMATVYYEKGALVRAEELLKQSININRHGDERMDAQLTQLKLAGIYIDSRKFRLAAALLADMRMSLDTLPNIRAKLQWLRLNAVCTTARQPGGIDSSLRQYLRLKDSLDAEDRRMYSADFGLELDALEHLEELRQVKKKNELHQLYLGIIVTFSVMAALIFLLVLRNWRTSKKHIHVLTRLNEDMIAKNRHLMQTLDSLEKSQQQNTYMMKVIAHDLRGPIGAIAGFTEWLRVGPKDQDTTAILPLMHTTAESALSLIDDLLHLNIALTDIRPEPIELTALLQYCIQIQKPKAAEKNQKITLSAADNTMVNADREKILRVFNNIAGNALKFSPIGGAVTVSLKKEGGQAIVAIADAGIGIPKSIQAKLFEMSPDAKRKGTAGEPSFGLGLNISKQIIQAHGGVIRFESLPGKGTTFYIELPLLS